METRKRLAHKPNNTPASPAALCEEGIEPVSVAASPLFGGGRPRRVSFSSPEATSTPVPFASFLFTWTFICILLVGTGWLAFNLGQSFSSSGDPLVFLNKPLARLPGVALVPMEELAELQECQEAKTADEVALMARLEHLREITETRS